MRDFRRLKYWEKAHRLTLAVYETTASFPREEQFGLTSQLRRACSSIPANIAEGCGRDGNAEFQRFLRMAAGSASELKYHLLLARDLQLIAPPDYDKLSEEVTEVKRMISVFIQRLASVE